MPPQPAGGPVEDIVVAGDSLALGLFAPLQAALQTPHRPVGFTWALVVVDDSRRVWERLFTDDRPDVVIVHFSVWENATLRGNEIIDTRDDAWPEIYRRQVVDPWIDRAVDSDSHVVWVGSPPTADPTRWAQHRELDDVWRTAVLEAAERQRRKGDVPSLEWIDIDTLLSGPGGVYTELDPTSDPPERWFNTDGMHWCPAGAGLVSELVVDALAASVDLGTDRRPAIPDWHVAPWANEPVAVPSAQGTFGDLQVAYPEGECPPAAAEASAG